MSDAFSKVSYLKFLVDVSEYLKLEGTNEGADYNYAELNPLVIELNVDLVTSADEVVKKILREVYNIFATKIRPKT